MDVRCEQCKTEYEFDDARITEAGVTVKCTTCSHVFKVKKKALVVTVPVKPEDSADRASGTLPPAGALGTSGEKAPPNKEWKVRQANGNVFTFKELTTLQKWIVERKVSREDDISLTGDSWKRLGNIAELASFFQVVEEAQKAQQLAAIQAAQQPLAYMPPGATPSGGYAVPSGDGARGPSAYPPSAASTRPTEQAMPAVLQQQTYPGSAGAVTQPNMPATVTASAQPAATQPQINVTVHSPMQPPPPPAAARAPSTTVEDMAAAQIKQGSGATGVLLTILILVLLGGGGAYYYLEHWTPQQKELQRDADAKAAADRKAAEERGAAAEKARQQSAADAEKAKAAAAAAAPVDAGTVVAASGQAPAKKLDFDALMSMGDNLRERDKAERALDAYGRAGELKPDRAEPYAGKGWALLDMGNKPAAEAAFVHALKLNPRYGVALMGLAETYRAEGKNEQAIKYYVQYLDILPDGPEANVARQALKRLRE